MKLTLPRFLVTTSWIFCGVALGFLLGQSWGVAGFSIGLILGIAIAFLLTWLVLLGRLLVFFPFPPCAHGKCHRFRDFYWRKGTIYGWEGGVYRYKCRCGDEYIRRGRMWMKVLANDSTQPYKRLIGFRRWADDAANSPSVANRC